MAVQPPEPVSPEAARLDVVIDLLTRILDRLPDKGTDVTDVTGQ